MRWVLAEAAIGGKPREGRAYYYGLDVYPPSRSHYWPMVLWLGLWLAGISLVWLVECPNACAEFDVARLLRTKYNSAAKFIGILLTGESSITADRI